MTPNILIKSVFHAHNRNTLALIVFVLPGNPIYQVARNNAGGSRTAIIMQIKINEKFHFSSFILRDRSELHPYDWNI